MTGRRAVLKASLGLGVSLASALRAGQVNEASARPKPGDLLVKDGDAAKTPLRPADIPVDAIQTHAWAMDPASGIVRNGSRLNQLIVLRLDPASLATETRTRAADGVVAYTAICTHEGCDIDNWLAEQHVVSCSCHFSTFDPKDGARVIEGPAPRMLPALPLQVVDGRLVVAGPFTARVGFESG